MSVNVRIRNGITRSGGVGGITEGDLRGEWSDAIGAMGVVDLAGGDLLVTQAGTPAMTVVVGTGVAYIPNSSFSRTDSDSIKFWEAVVAGTTLSRTLTIAANSSGQTRIDLICINLDPGASPDGTGSNVATLIVVQGTPGAGVPATPSYHLALAQVTVANGATSIVTANIADLRVQSQLASVFLPDTITGKSIGDPTTPSKKLAYDLSGATAAKTVTLKSNHTNNRTVTLPDATTTLVGKDTTDTLTNKAITKRVTSTASSATPTPNSDTTDVYILTALAAAAAFAAPTGTPNDGQTLIIRIKDNGTARALTWNAAYRAIGTVLPTTTVINKTIYVGLIYNSASSTWDVLAVQSEI